MLAARLDSMGDVLLAGPAVRALARDCGELTLLSGPRGEAAARLLPGPRRVEVLAAPWIDAEPEPVVRPVLEAFIDRIGELAVDEALIFTSFHQSPLPLALLLRMAGVPRVAGISDDYPGSLLDVRHRAPQDIHEVERALSLVDAAGHPAPSGPLDIRRPGTLPAAVRGLGPFVAVHPGAAAAARTWSPERHRALVRLLVLHRREVVVTGNAQERDLVAYVAGNEALALTGGLPLGDLAEVLAAAEVVVCGNTGPAHLAAAVGTPVVSLFAPVVPAARWRPWMVPHVLLGDQSAPCAGSRARVCPVPGHPCLDAVAPESVLAALEELSAVPA